MLITARATMIILNILIPGIENNMFDAGFQGVDVVEEVAFRSVY